MVMGASLGWLALLWHSYLEAGKGLCFSASLKCTVVYRVYCITAGLVMTSFKLDFSGDYSTVIPKVALLEKSRSALSIRVLF